MITPNEVPDVESIFQTWYLLTALPIAKRQFFIDSAMWRISNSDFAYLRKVTVAPMQQSLIEYDNNTNKYRMFGVVIDICRNVDCRFPQLVLTIEKRNLA